MERKKTIDEIEQQVKALLSGKGLGVNSFRAAAAVPAKVPPTEVKAYISGLGSKLLDDCANLLPIGEGRIGARRLYLRNGELHLLKGFGNQRKKALIGLEGKSPIATAGLEDTLLQKLSSPEGVTLRGFCGLYSSSDILGRVAKKCQELFKTYCRNGNSTVIRLREGKLHVARFNNFTKTVSWEQTFEIEERSVIPVTTPSTPTHRLLAVPMDQDKIKTVAPVTQPVEPPSFQVPPGKKMVLTVETPQMGNIEKEISQLREEVAGLKSMLGNMLELFKSIAAEPTSTPTKVPEPAVQVAEKPTPATVVLQAAPGVKVGLSSEEQTEVYVPKKRVLAFGWDEARYESLQKYNPDITIIGVPRLGRNENDRKFQNALNGHYDAVVINTGNCGHHNVDMAKNACKKRNAKFLPSTESSMRLVHEMVRKNLDLHEVLWGVK